MGGSGRRTARKAGRAGEGRGVLSRGVRQPAHRGRPGSPPGSLAPSCFCWPPTAGSAPAHKERPLASTPTTPHPLHTAPLSPQATPTVPAPPQPPTSPSVFGIRDHPTQAPGPILFPHYPFSLQITPRLLHPPFTYFSPAHGPPAARGLSPSRAPPPAGLQPIIPAPFTPQSPIRQYGLASSSGPAPYWPQFSFR